jgi:hypothetical protein
MERRVFLIGAGSTVALAGCVGDNEDTEVSSGSDTNAEEEEQSTEPTENETETESEPEPERETEQPDPAEFEVTDLSVDPSEITSGESVTVAATVQNIGGTEGTEELEFNIEGETVDEQSVGDSTFEEVTNGETVTEQVTVTPGESTTVSLSLTPKLTGSFNVSVADRSVNFEVVREWNEIGEEYEGAGGLTVILESLDVTEKTGSYEYTIQYKLENETDEGIDEGGFQLYPADSSNDPLQQYGGFGELFPGDTVSRSYTFEEEKSIEYDTLAYHPDQFFRQTPPSDALVWSIEY